MDVGKGPVARPQESARGIPLFAVWVFLDKKGRVTNGGNSHAHEVVDV
jgi:hypothetical protein